MRRRAVAISIAVVVVAAAVAVMTLGGGAPDRAVVGDVPTSPRTSAVAFPDPVDDPAEPGPRDVDLPEHRPDDLAVKPGDDVAAIVASAPIGATIRFEAGVYRELELEPKDDQVFVAEPGVILNGSRVLNGFVQVGDVWSVDDQTHGSPDAVEGNDWGFCDEERPACVFPEDLFVDGAPVSRVGSESEVAAGTWFFDYATDRIVMGDDPSGHVVETSVGTWAFHGASDRVEIYGFEIIQYANPGRQGAINPRQGGRIGPAGRSWKVIGNAIRNVHGWGVKIEDGMTLTDNVIVGGGQGGVGGVGDGLLIEHNRIDGNCTAGFRCLGWEGGALKLSTSETTIRANVVEGNFGHGLHTDINCVDVIIEDNLVVDNQGAGIHHEISGRAVIRDNTVIGNGFRPDGERDAGIFVLSSSDVLVERNVVEGNADGIFLRQDHRTGDGLLERVTVRDNVIVMGEGSKSGFGFSARALFVEAENAGLVFEGNTWRLQGDAAASEPFQADDRRLDAAGWQGAGYDADGTVEELG